MHTVSERLRCCGRGIASTHDGKCGHCRTRREQKALDEYFYQQAKLEREREKLSKMLYGE